MTSQNGEALRVRPTPPTRRELRDRAVRRYLVVVVVVAGVTALAVPFRTTANERHAHGIEAVARLDAAFGAVRDGDAVVTGTTTEVVPGVLAAVVDTSPAARVVAVTSTPSGCYGLWWDEALARHGRIVDDELACEPAPIVTSSRPIHFERAGPVEPDPGAQYPWMEVLPPSQRLRLWVIPGAVVALGVCLSALVRMSLVLITGEPLARRPR